MRPRVEAGFSDILGQDRVCRRLWAAVANDRLHHCYLFEGPQGVGKATVALRLAMAANCESAGAEIPCNRCPTCQHIASGNHPDVLELGPDLESGTPVIRIEQVRELIHLLSIHRHSARRRFVIIDGIDVMGVAATNAMLKTLEEPPEYSGFVLVTSRPRMLLPTVLSRSLRVRFRSIPVQQLEPWLRERGVPEPERMARLSFGSPGVALELAGGRAKALAEARLKLVEALSAGPKELFDYADALCSSTRSGSAERVQTTLEVLETLLRDTVNQASGRANALLEPDEAELSARWAAALWPSGIVRMEGALALARQRIHLNVQSRLVIEALLSTLCVELGAWDARSP